MDYTSAVSIALQHAAVWAHRLGSETVQPVHLLLGLLHEEEGRPAILLGKRGVNPETVRTALAPMPGEPASVDPAHLGLSLPAQEILHHAGELGRSLSAEFVVASEQVLLAILREDEALRGKLESMGLDFTLLERDVLGEQGPAIHLDEPLNLHEPAEQIDTARILDAAANRAREGLRVLEDYCRFALNDGLLSAELKRLRHGLADALKMLPAHALLAARDTLGDVGTAISTPAEHERASSLAVVQANMKRLQEALRSLEEFGKLYHAEVGQAVESLRYRAYTLEQSILIGSHARERLGDASLYVLVTEANCRASLSGTISEAAAGGAQMFQLREKGLDDRTLLARAREVRAVTRKAGVLFIMNDRPDIARLAEADGVHLGQDDLPIHQVRRILGPDALIGVSTHTIDQVRQAVLEGASYIGVGPTFPSNTKRFDSLAGLDFVRQVLGETSLPAFVIGGITVENLAETIAAGARRVAVSNAIIQAEDPRQTAGRMRQMLAGGAERGKDG